MVDPNLVGIPDINGRCVLAWFDSELLGKTFDEGLEVLTYDLIKGKSAIPGNWGAKQKYAVGKDEFQFGDEFLTYIGEGPKGEVYLNIPRDCNPNGESDIRKFKKIGTWGEPDEEASAVMPEAEGNWGDTGTSGMIRVYPKGYKPIQP